MDVINRSPYSSDARRQPLEVLQSLDSETLVKDTLSEIVGAYGEVLAISRVVPKEGDVDGECKYLVNFDCTQDAMAAAAELKCFLVGFSVLLVPVSKNRQCSGSH